MNKRLRRGAAAAVLLAGALGTSASAAGAGRAELQVGLSTRAPAAHTGLDVHVLYRHPDDPDRKPPALTKAIFELPAGTRIDGSAVARCKASDEELQSQGRDACPASSMVGSGSFTAMTGLPGADPVDTDTTIYNGGDQLIELVTFKGTNTTAGFDRLAIKGSSLVAHPPATPGGPPDGRTVPRDIRVSIPERGRFITSPPSCPGSGLWSSRGVFAFADGGQAIVSATSPCAAGSSAAPRPRAKLRLAPRRVRAGRRVRLRFRALPVAGPCSRGATVRLGRHHARTNRRGRATMKVRFRRAGPRRLTLVKRGCRRVHARLVVLPAR